MSDELKAAVDHWREVQLTLADDEQLDADMKATGGELRVILDFIDQRMQASASDR